MLESNEVPLFKHSITVKGREGEIVVTSSHLQIIFTKDGQHQNFTWSNISNIKYSAPNDPKGRALVLLKTVVSGCEDYIIRLTGSSTEKRFSELERLKSIVSNVRKKSESVTTNVTATTINSADSSGIKRLREGSTTESVSKKRKQLLEADKVLAKHYRELVAGNVISDEDFWQNHASLPVHGNKLKLLATDSALEKGKSNSLISDIFEIGSDGEIHINLTVEKKYNIFLMNPTVRRAFEAEVPLKRTEASFWEAYFRSEFYSQQGNSSATVGMNHRDLGLISRYETDDTSKVEGTAPSIHLKLTGKVDDGMDLTATYGDYTYKEQLDASDEAAATNAHDNTGDAHKVVSKYNKNSMLVMGTDPTNPKPDVIQSDKGKNIRVADSLKLAELYEQHDVTYLPLTLNNTSTSSNSGHNRDQSHSQDTPVSPPSAFVSSSSRKHRLSQQGAANGRDGLSAFELPPAGILLADLASCLPDGNRSAELFKADISRLRKATRSESQISTGDTPNKLPNSNSNAVEEIIGGTGNSDLASFLWLDGTSEATSRSRLDASQVLDPQFTQEMLEKYTDVTELLMHYYAMLTRSTQQAIAKAEAILKRLVNHESKALETRKMQLTTSYRKSMQSNPQQFSAIQALSEDDSQALEAKLSVINGILQLIQRANTAWTLYKH